MALTKKEEQALFKLKEELQKKYKIFDFKLYGSKARGTDEPDSDIDVMVELEEVNPDVRRKTSEIVAEINLEYDCFISIIWFSRKELEEGPMSESPLYKAILREGIAI